jgi:hypothetical protein
MAALALVAVLGARLTLIARVGRLGVPHATLEVTPRKKRVDKLASPPHRSIRGAEGRPRKVRSKTDAFKDGEEKAKQKPIDMGTGAASSRRRPEDLAPTRTKAGERGRTSRDTREGFLHPRSCAQAIAR